MIRRPAHTTVILAAATVATIAALTTLRIADGPSSIVLALQVVLVAAFASLAAFNFQAAVAIALVELAIGGASGHWTQFPGGVSGRIVIDGIVMVRALAYLAGEWRRSGRIRIGSYAPHAVLVGLVVGGIWMALGLVNGNQPAMVFADGNGQLFLAFTIVFAVLIRQGHGAWLRTWFFVACAANALVIGAAILLSAADIVPLFPTMRHVLLDVLDFGGTVGYMPNGAFRLYVGSGIYLQVGLALTTWRLLDDPRRLAYWALYALLWVDVIATYARGFWLGATIAVGLVLLLGGSELRRPAAVIAASTALLVAATVASFAIGASLPDYLFQRAATTLAVAPGDAATSQPSIGPESSGAPVPASPTPGIDSADTAGLDSNEMRAEQARVLLRHIAERPLFGYGFGSVASDYRYGTSFSYELSYLDIWYKTGLVGTLLFFTYPMRLVVAGLRGRLGRIPLPEGVSPRELSVVIAILIAVLLTGATNPYVLAAFGMTTLLVCVAWLDKPDVVGAGSAESAVPGYRSQTVDRLPARPGGGTTVSTSSIRPGWSTVRARLGLDS